MRRLEPGLDGDAVASVQKGGFPDDWSRRSLRPRARKAADDLLGVAVRPRGVEIDLEAQAFAAGVERRA
jgi:hypothetical protein